ncbi:MAG: FHA domain-containing protein [Tepidisphaerales bacterium]
MGLQLRIRHALGARMVEIPGRAGDNPVRVGRDASCDVPIPSGQVSPVHCLLYMHEGKWIVASAGPAVLLNGQELAEPQYLEFGDKISLGAGPSAAVIEVDPVGAARQSATATPPSSARPSAPTHVNWAANHPDQPASNGGWTPAQVAAGAASEGGPEANPEEYAALQALGGAEASTYRPRRRPNKQSNIGLAVGLIVVVLVGGILVIYMLAKPDNPDSQTVVKPAPGLTGGGTVPDFGPGGRKPRSNIFTNPKTAPAPVVNRDPDTPPVVTTTQNPDDDPPAKAAQTDPRKQTEEWQNVETMRSSLDTARAIWVFDDYMHRHAGQFDEELKKDIESSLDRLWWERVKGLMDERKEAQADVEKKKADLLDEKPDSEFARTIEKDIERVKFRIDSINEMLKGDMAYTSEQTPNLFDDAQLALLRGERNKGVFEKWSKGKLEYIRRNGKAPWPTR